MVEGDGGGSATDLHASKLGRSLCCSATLRRLSGDIYAEICPKPDIYAAETVALSETEIEMSAPVSCLVHVFNVHCLMSPSIEVHVPPFAPPPICRCAPLGVVAPAQLNYLERLDA